MGQILSPLAALFRNHKMKMLIALGFTLVFAVILFPNDDLSDYVSAQVSKSSGMYIEMNNLGFDLFPSPGVNAHDVSIEPRGVRPLKVGGLSTHISLGKVLTARLGFSADFEKIFRGDINLVYGQGDKAKSGERFDELALHGEKVSLDDVSDYLKSSGQLGMKLQGSLKLDTNLRLDHSFSEQPSAVVSADIGSFSIPSQSIMIDFNGVPVAQQLPTLELGRVVLRNAKLKDGTLEISEMTIGDPKAEIFGKMKGTMSLLLRKNPMGVQPEISNVDMAMDLQIDQSFYDRNQKSVLGGFFLLIPPAAKQDTPKGPRLAFRLKLNRAGEPPNFVPLTEKL